MFAFVQHLKRLKLTVQEPWGHEMPASPCDAFGQYRFRRMEMNEHHRHACGRSDHVAIGTLQRRAANHSGLRRSGKRFTHQPQPWGAIGIVQRLAPPHLVDVALGMQVIAVNERQTLAHCEALPHRAFAAARHAHDDSVFVQNDDACSRLLAVEFSLVR